MNLGISHPETLPHIEFPNLITDNALKNVYLLNESRVNFYIQKVSEGAKPLDEIWEDPPYVVNAYYYNELNEFFLPAGTLQFPFYIQDKKKVGWNYGGLGAIIGHEMTHAFDEEGKKYISAGIKKDWWTRKDTLRYNKMTAALVTLFNKNKILGNPVDGSLTLSENLSDLGGLGIALDALHEELKGATDQEKNHQLREFFLSYAVSWRVKQRHRRILQNLFLDVHAPADLRVNNIVCHFQEWYDCFGVKTGNALYIPPEERIVIF
jgi:putative endopeptidase